MKDHGFVLDNDLGYFVHHGVQVMAFDDIYPAVFVAANGICIGRRFITLHVSCSCSY